MILRAPARVSSVALLLLLSNGFSGRGLAQPNPAPLRPHFEVASIKENRSGNGPVSVTGVNRGDRLTATNISVATLITLAYKVQFYQMTGGPAWLISDRFDIVAKADAEAAARSPMLPMLQTLLEDRFELRTHRENREMAVFALTLAKDGPKLKRVAEGDCEVPAPGTPPPALSPGQKPIPACGSWYGSGTRVSGRRVSMEQITTLLRGILGRTVIDQTGLTGYFDFDFEWTPDSQHVSAGDPDQSSTAVDSGAPTAVTAIQEQLGLIVKSTKGQVEMLVVDHIQRPSEN
jgi:uncharacterized protein (TIGR03435 family)